MAVIVLNEKFEKSSETLELPESFKNIHPHNLYLYIKAYQAGLRANTARVKNRSAVRGGGKKPWSQKGRGGARAGSRRSPLFVGGGVIFGPTKRNYTQKVNKKQQILALKFALNELAEKNLLFVVDRVRVESGKTKDANTLFKNLDVKNALIVADEVGEKEVLAFRNLPNCELVGRSGLNGWSASRYQAVILEKSIWNKLVEES